MKIVIAPDSFKESLAANQVARAIQSGFQSIFPNANYHLLPIADGGEGTVQALSNANGGEMVNVSVTGPLGEKVEAKLAFSRDQKTAYIEMAEACGLHLVPYESRNGLNTTSYGVGELMIYALDNGVKELIVGVGGSSTNDGGIGMASALGYQFFNQKGDQVPGRGQDLFEIVEMSSAKRDKRLDYVKITIAADVSNPLTGPNGASYIYGPQKGLSEDVLAETDAAMGRFFQLAEQQLGKTVSDLPGSGAGGGIGAGLLLFANATLKKGIELVLEQLKMKELCSDADLVIVGEGKMDGQTVNGKAPIGVAACAPASAYVIAICGSVGDDIDVLYDNGIDAIFPTIPSLVAKDTLMSQAYQNVERTARNIAVLLRRKGE